MFDNNWYQAIDEQLVAAGLGVLKPNASLEEAKKAVNDLIDWHVSVALTFSKEAP